MPQAVPRAAGHPLAHQRQNLYVFNGGLIWGNRTARRILDLAGYDLRLGLPQAQDCVGVWGASPTAWRGARIAQRYDAGLLRIEDAFLRSLHPGRSGAAPLGLLLDRSGVHFDSRQPSYLETLLATHPLDDTALLDAADVALLRMQEAHLTKYAAVDPELATPMPGYVLVIDQTRGDASVTASGADQASFRAMLAQAQHDHPDRPIVIKTHPETRAAYRPGHFEQADAKGAVTFLSDPVSPWTLLAGAEAVYCVSSQLGLEAIFAGHKPHVFGQPIYGGWGLSHDHKPLPNRTRSLTARQLFAACMILAPTWYDSYRDRLCGIDQVIDTLEAQSRAWREDRAGWVASGMRLWKRPALQATFGQVTPVVFSEKPRPGRRHMIWASKGRAEVQVEDGFLRSRGLGAALTPPLSLVLDDLGIYYDPSTESRLERLLNAAPALRPDQLTRAANLRAKIVEAGLSKYNLSRTRAPLPPGPHILVVGQVEDDASILRGTEKITTNRALLEAARSAHAEASLLYKPHPDVEAGLRKGVVKNAQEIADIVLDNTDPVTLLTEVSEVWTMTSLLGFEALLRGVPVTTLGAPFYAGWGLTKDLGAVPKRRRATLTLDQLVHAALIAYPRYVDPVTGTACPPEVIVDRLAKGETPNPSAANRLLSKVQGLLASYAHLWR